MVSLGDSLDYIGGIIVVAMMLVGLFQISSSLGSVEDMMRNIMGHPSTFGLGLFVFLIGYFTWTPAIPLSRYGLDPLRILYPFADGYFMGFSLWTLLFTLIVTIVVTLLLMKIYSLDFWFEGFGIATVTFVISWYVWGWIAWKLMYIGGNLIGFSNAEVYAFWHGTVTATSSPLLQIFFLASIPISALWLTKKVVSII